MLFRKSVPKSSSARRAVFSRSRVGSLNSNTVSVRSAQSHPPRDERGGVEPFRPQEPRRRVHREDLVEGIPPGPIARQVPIPECVDADVFEDVCQEEHEARQIANGPKVRVEHVIALVDAGAPRVDHAERIREVDSTELNHLPVRAGSGSVETDLDPVVAAQDPQADARHAFGNGRVARKELCVQHRTNLPEEVRNLHEAGEGLLGLLHLGKERLSFVPPFVDNRHLRIVRRETVRLKASRPQSGKRFFHLAYERIDARVGFDRCRPRDGGGG